MSERILRQAEDVIGKAIIDKLEDANRQVYELGIKASVEKAGHLFRLKNYPTPYLSLDDEDLVQRK